MLADNLLEVNISDVSITNVGFAIFLKPTQPGFNKVVPIFIGPLETYSISNALDGVIPPRPNTHDLVVNMLQEMESHIMHVVINDIIGSIFYARLVIKTEDGVVELDARPSDSVAIAIRAKCPIYMNAKVYQEASVSIGEETPPDDEEIKESTPPVKTEQGSKSKLEQLKQQLQEAVKEENFEKAAILRDKINKIAQEN